MYFISKFADETNAQQPRRRARDVAEAVAAAVPLTGRERMLEYGAGTGLVSQALAERVGPITLADTSSGMRSVMEGKIAAGALPPWLGDPALHRSHQSNLVRKDPAFYKERFPDVPDDLPYVWPVRSAARNP